MKKIIFSVVALVLVAGTVVYAKTSKNADNCCTTTKECCIVGSSCCE